MNLKEFSPAGLVSPEISEWLALPPTADTARQERHATATTTHPTRPTARPSRAAHVSRTRTSHQRPSRHRAWRAAPRSARQLDSRSLSRLAAAANWVCLNAGTRTVPTKLSSGCSEAKLTQKSFFYVWILGVRQDNMHPDILAKLSRSSCSYLFLVTFVQTEGIFGTFVEHRQETERVPLSTKWQIRPIKRV